MSGLASDDLVPPSENRLAFGRWTIGHPGRDPFGGVTRPHINPVDFVRGLAEIGPRSYDNEWLDQLVIDHILGV